MSERRLSPPSLHVQRDLQLALGCLCRLPLGDAVFVEVEGLLLHRVVLRHVALLGRAQEGADALRVIAQGLQEIVPGWHALLICCFHYFVLLIVIN